MFKINKLYIYFLLTLINIQYNNGQWIRHEIPSNLGMLLSADFKNNISGLTSGWRFDSVYSGGGIVATTNSGLNWFNTNTPDSVRSVVKVAYVTDNLVYACGAYNINIPLPNNIKTKKDILTTRMITSSDTVYYKGLFMRSTNAGFNWTTINSLPDSIYYLLAMQFMNENTGYLIGDRSYGTFTAKSDMFKTTNEGFSWYKVNLPTYISEIKNFQFINSYTAFCTGYYETGDSLNPYNGFIIKSTDQGITWSSFNFPEVNSFTDIVFKNDNTGFACGVSTLAASGIIYKTTNSGLNWHKLSYETNDAFFLGCEADDLNLIITGLLTFYSGSGSYTKPYFAHSSDEGLTWTTEIFNNKYHLFSDAVLNNGQAYVFGGNLDTALMYQNPNISIGIDGNVTQLVSFRLYQNYPNPFNGETKIRFNINKTGYYNLSVYNIYGQLIETIVNNRLPIGDFSFSWKPDNVSSGMYFYKLVSVDNSETKKMILIK